LAWRIGAPRNDVRINASDLTSSSGRMLIDVDSAPESASNYVQARTRRTCYEPTYRFWRATVGGLIAFQCLPRGLRQRLTAAVRHWMTNHMEEMIASLPEDASPKLIISILPKLQARNDFRYELFAQRGDISCQVRHLFSGEG
jgi:hypothetical protein